MSKLLLSDPPRYPEPDPSRPATSRVAQAAVAIISVIGITLGIAVLLLNISDGIRGTRLWEPFIYAELLGLCAGLVAIQMHREHRQFLAYAFTVAVEFEELVTFAQDKAPVGTRVFDPALAETARRWRQRLIADGAFEIAERFQNVILRSDIEAKA